MPIIKRTHTRPFEVRLSVMPGAPPVWYVKVWSNSSQVYQTAQFMTRATADDVYDKWSALVLSNVMAPMEAFEFTNALKAAVDDALGVR